MHEPIIRLRGITKSFKSGDIVTEVLHGIDIDIYQGEFIAIIGSSGSGKSTLMNIIGCLDQPTSGEYHFIGKDISTFSHDELATLRREAFGFIFQSYNLIHSLSASENVEVPSVYAGVSRDERRVRATELLASLGLEHRVDYRPSQLSGGQQQRVSIARALMNGGDIILADEPTGALDSKSGQEVLALLKKLSDEGHTVILITHDKEIAQNAKRVIEIKDGLIIKDTKGFAPEIKKPLSQPVDKKSLKSEIVESLRSATKSLKMNIYRTILTLLGIVIGVASVIVMLAIGDGAKYAVLDRIGSMGTNILIIRPGMANSRGFSDIATLVFSDVEAINELDNVIAASPESKQSVTVRYGYNDTSTMINTVTYNYPKIRQWEVRDGVFFSEEDELSYAKVAVIGQSVVDELFKEKDPIGEFILIKNIPYQVVGVMSKKGASAFGEDEDDVIFLPYTSGSLQITGLTYLRNITVALKDTTHLQKSEDAIRELLLQRHNGVEDFRVRNMASLIEDMVQTQDTMTILLGSIAAISLLVGGIGIMNIMLVSVTERTKEIGIRMATGARARNIMQQFLIEAVVVSGIGGAIGVVIGLGVTYVVEYLGTPIYYSLFPVVLAFGFSFVTGLIFGYLPAKKAAALNPVIALTSE